VVTLTLTCVVRSRSTPLAVTPSIVDLMFSSSGLRAGCPRPEGRHSAGSVHLHRALNTDAWHGWRRGVELKHEHAEN